MSSSPTITIGVVPRERFALGAETIKRIVKNTNLPYRLIVVDCNIPEPYCHQIEQALPSGIAVEVLRFGSYLLPNESRNQVISATTDEFVCLIDNDVLVEPGWLERMLDACKAEAAGVVRPTVLKHGKVHFDCRLGPVSAAIGSPGNREQIGNLTEANESDLKKSRRVVNWLEMHCLLFRRDVFSEIGLLDKRLNTREHVDLSMALRAKNIPIVFEPASVVHFVPPPPVQPMERDFFHFRWDPAQAVISNARIKTQRNLTRYCSNIDWVIARQSRTSGLKNLVNELWQKPAFLKSLPGRVKWNLVERKKQWQRSTARKRFGNLPGLEGGPLRIPLHDKNTGYIRAGAVTFGVERRLPAHGDPGVSLHVFSEHDGGELVERFRVDCLHDSPHYHYVFQQQKINQKFFLDPMVVKDAHTWALDMIQKRLPAIFSTVGGAEIEKLVDMAEIERVLPKVAQELQSAASWADPNGDEQGYPATGKN